MSRERCSSSRVSALRVIGPVQLALTFPSLEGWLYGKGEGRRPGTRVFGTGSVHVQHRLPGINTHSSLSFSLVSIQPPVEG